MLQQQINKFSISQSVVLNIQKCPLLV